jgi:hypothetical protein
MDFLLEDISCTPSRGLRYVFDDYNDVDFNKLTITLTGRAGGLR